MEKIEKSFFNQIEQAEKTPEPGTLDVVKINNQWVQVIAVGDGKSKVKYLNIPKSESTLPDIIWDDYKLVTQYGLRIKDLLDLGIIDLNKSEIENVHYACGEPERKMDVRVFGEYEKK